LSLRTGTLRGGDTAKLGLHLSSSALARSAIDYPTYKPSSKLAQDWGKPVVVHQHAAEYPLRVLDLLPGGEAYDLAEAGPSATLGSGRQPPLWLRT
jgi:hypothetical protein